MDIKILKTQTDEIGRKYIEISPTARILFKDDAVYFCANTEKGLMEYRIDPPGVFDYNRLAALYFGFTGDSDFDMTKDFEN